MGLRVEIKNLFCGFLPKNEATIYTVPQKRSAVIKVWRLTNESDVPRTVNIRAVRGGSYARLVPYNFHFCGRSSAKDDSLITLEAGDRILAACDLGASVTCLLSGVEEILT